MKFIINRPPIFITVLMLMTSIFLAIKFFFQYAEWQKQKFEVLSLQKKNIRQQDLLSAMTVLQHRYSVLRLILENTVKDIDIEKLPEQSFLYATLENHANQDRLIPLSIKSREEMRNGKKIKVFKVIAQGNYSQFIDFLTRVSRSLMIIEQLKISKTHHDDLTIEVSLRESSFKLPDMNGIKKITNPYQTRLIYRNPFAIQVAHIPLAHMRYAGFILNAVDQCVLIRRPDQKTQALCVGEKLGLDQATLLKVTDSEIVLQNSSSRLSVPTNPNSWNSIME